MISPLENKALLTFFSEVKKLAILNQCYELAAASRDYEKRILNGDILNTNKCYEDAKYLVDTYKQTVTMRPILENHLKQLHYVIMRSEVRSDIISKILGDSN